MSLEVHTETIAQWLEDVDVSTASGRIAADYEENSRRESRVFSATAADPDMCRISYHEAAHAVSAHLFGFRVELVCIRADGSGVSSYIPSEDATLDFMIRDVTITLAGAAIELLAGAGENYFRRYHLRRSADIMSGRLQADKCRALAPSLGLTNRFFAASAVCLVFSNLDAIARVAAAVRQAGELDDASVAALCGTLH